MRINQFALPAFIGAAFCTSAGAQTLFHDDFSGSIDPAWSILRPDTSFYTIKPTELDVRVSKRLETLTSFWLHRTAGVY